MLPGGGDDVARHQRPAEEIALERLARPLQPHFALGRGKDHPRGRLAFSLADLDVIARSSLGIAALQAVKPDHLQPFVLRVRRLNPGCGYALTLDLDHIAFGHPQRGKGGAGQPGEAAAAFLLPCRGDLKLDGGLEGIGHLYSKLLA